MTDLERAIVLIKHLLPSLTTPEFQARAVADARAFIDEMEPAPPMLELPPDPIDVIRWMAARPES